MKCQEAPAEISLVCGGGEVACSVGQWNDRLMAGTIILFLKIICPSLERAARTLLSRDTQRAKGAMASAAESTIPRSRHSRLSISLQYETLEAAALSTWLAALCARATSNKSRKGL